MTTWREFTEAAPRIAAIFTRRHAATGNLCLLATLRSDGFPRISPIEPRVFEDQLWIVGMPGTTKFRDLGRDPRFCLHTATVDTEVKDGDAKLWGVVDDVQARLRPPAVRPGRVTSDSRQCSPGRWLYAGVGNPRRRASP